jgi:hypothetical protein
MSGSDPSVRRPGSGGGGGGGGPANGCPGPDFETAVGSPFPDAVANLSVGEVLDVESIDDGAVRGVMFRTIEGEHVGALATDILRLRSCMAEGWNYEAVVLRKAGGSVIVEIRSADA